MASRALLMLAFICLACLLSGCGTFQQESDWRWQQMNPNYTPLYPPDQAGRY